MDETVERTVQPFTTVFLYVCLIFLCLSLLVFHRPRVGGSKGQLRWPTAKKKGIGTVVECVLLYHLLPSSPRFGTRHWKLTTFFLFLLPVNNKQAFHFLAAFGALAQSPIRTKTLSMTRVRWALVFMWHRRNKQQMHIGTCGADDQRVVCLDRNFQFLEPLSRHSMKNWSKPPDLKCLITYSGILRKICYSFFLYNFIICLFLWVFKSYLRVYQEQKLFRNF